MNITKFIHYLQNIIFSVDYDKYRYNKKMSQINERITRDKNGESY